MLIIITNISKFQSTPASQARRPASAWAIGAIGNFVCLLLNGTSAQKGY